MKKNIKSALVILVLAGVGIVVVRDRVGTVPVRLHQPAQIVKTVLAQKKSIPVVLDANGTVTAMNIVEIRPQLQNKVRAVHVREGQDVQLGQLLFTLDGRSESLGVDKAKAQWMRDQADLADAELSLKRTQDLVSKQFLSQAALDSATNKVASLKAAVLADQAAIGSSQVTSGYNEIRAPSAGRLGAISVHPGSVMQAAGAPWVVIAQIDPIEVSFSVPERQLQDVLHNFSKGTVAVSAQLPNGQKRQGTLVFIDNAVDAQSGTVRMKARFANTDRMLWPGAFVTVQCTVTTVPDAIVVPGQAIVIGPTESFVYVVQPNETVTKQKVTLLLTVAGQAVVSGVQVGARVVVEGTQNLHPGSAVKEMTSVTPSPSAQHKP